MKVPVGGVFSRPQISSRAPAVYERADDLEAEELGYVARFTVTSEILSLITKIERFVGFLVGAKLPARWLRNMQNEAILVEAHHTTHIEGTSLTLTQSRLILEGRTPANVDFNEAQELRNYRHAFEMVSAYLKNGFPITEIAIREIHKILVENVRGDAARPGEYRTLQNYVKNSMTGEIIYEPPGANEVPRLMSDLVDWLKHSDVHPVIAAAIAHFQLVHIHPFLDGNGRTARLLATLVLYRAGYDFKNLFSISEYYDLDRTSYYAAIQEVRDGDMDVTSWIRYFSDGLVSQMADVKRKAVRAIYVDVIAGEYILSLRQQDLLEALMGKDGLTLDELAETSVGASAQSLRRDLSSMQDKGIINISKTGRVNVYRVSEDITSRIRASDEESDIFRSA